MYKVNGSATIRVPVIGTVASEDGKPVKFSFSLQCKRLQQPEIDEMLKDPSAPMEGFIRAFTTGWHDVIGDDDQPLEFTDENFSTVLNQPGMRALCFSAFLAEVGVKQKN